MNVRPAPASAVALLGAAILVLALALLAQAPAPAHAAALQAGSITTGTTHSCAIRTSGQAVCWGNNGDGQLGDGTTTQRTNPTPVSGLADAKAISAGMGNTCAIRTSGQAVCWGRNSSSQLGDGTNEKRLVPTPVSGLADAKAITTAESHSCAIRDSGQVVCWGLNGNYRQIGDGTAVVTRPTPTSVIDLADAKEISAGSYHTCAIRTSGQAVCWGGNSNGQIGHGTPSGIGVPVTSVDGVADAKKIATGEQHSCAIRTSGQAVCWGYNYFGQIGDGTTVYRYTAVNVDGLADAKEIDAGYVDTCAVRTSGQAVCWGRNGDGQLGDGTKTDRHVPTPVSGLADAKAINTATFHTCAIRNSGEAVCWGRNQTSALGDGTSTDRLVPTAVVEGSDANGPGPGPDGKVTTLGSPKVKPASKTVKRGGKATFTFRVKNTGAAAAKGLKVCVKAPKKKISVKRCKSLASLAPGKTAAFKFKATVKGKAKLGKATLKFTATGEGIAKKTAKVVITVKKK